MKRRSFIAAAVAALVAPTVPAKPSPFASFVGFPIPDLKGPFIARADVYESNFGEHTHNVRDPGHSHTIWEPSPNEQWRGMVLYKDGAP